jgi:hypothetical protein
MAALMFAVMTVMVFARGDMSCIGMETCEESSGLAAVSASAMLQVKAEPTKDTSAPSPVAENLLQSGLCMPSENQEAHLMEARDCVPMELQEVHLKAVRHHARFLAAQNREGVILVGQQNLKKKAVQPGPPSLEDMLTPAPVPQSRPPSLEDMMTPAPAEEAPQSRPPSLEDMATPAPAEEAPQSGPPSLEDMMTPAPPSSASGALEAPKPASSAAPSAASGALVSLDAKGFKEATSLCCPAEMEVFFNRLLDSLDLEVCSIPHIQGLMHWFSCVPDMDFQYVLDIISGGNPCKYWTPRGDDCPSLSPKCAGQYCR